MKHDTRALTMTIASVAKFLASGLLMFAVTFLFVHVAYLLALAFAFDEESHIPHLTIAPALCLLAVLLLFASIYLHKRWSIRFWHKLSLNSLFALMAAVSIVMVLALRPAKMNSREIEQDGNVVKYHFSAPGLGYSGGWTIRLQNNRPLDELDKLAEHEVKLYYYWQSDDNVAWESLVFSFLIFTFVYFPSIPPLFRSNKKNTPSEREKQHDEGQERQASLGR